MSEEWFWGLIETSRAGATSLQQQCKALQAQLESLEVDGIFEFQRQFAGFVSEAYSWDLMAVGHIVNRGGDIENFDDFVGWLIAHGRSYFETAIAEPRRAADALEPGQQALCEEIWLAPADAYETKTGADDFFDMAHGVSLAMQGKRWEESQLPEMFPELYRRFCGSDS